MYFSLAKNTSHICKKPRGIAAGFNQLLWPYIAEQPFAAGRKSLQSEITTAQPLQNPFSLPRCNIKPVAKQI